METPFNGLLLSLKGKIAICNLDFDDKPLSQFFRSRELHTVFITVRHNHLLFLFIVSLATNHCLRYRDFIVVLTSSHYSLLLINYSHLQLLKHES
jgi:hypothetical protein